MNLTPAEKRLTVAIWQSPAFRGSREDAARIARDVMRAEPAAPDLFGFEFAEAEPPRNPALAGQCELF